MENLIAKGAEAELYAARFLDHDAVVKERGRKAYRAHALDARLRTERTRREARILHQAKLAGVRCPRLLHAEPERHRLYLERFEGRLLREYLPGAGGANRAWVLAECGRQLALLHEGGVAHGDSTTSNFLVSAGTPVLIDFGLAEFTTQIEEHATDVLLFKKSVSPADFEAFWQAYARGRKKSKEVLGRLREIERRGRYVVRSMAGG
jgi:Kae1-associated kinase Bud32